MSDGSAWAERASMIDAAGDAVAVLDIAAGEETADPPLLVLHGFPTSSIDFQLVIARLARQRRVVLFDFPGFGLSAKPDRPYSLFGQADVVTAVAARAGLNEVDLLTHDMGDSVGGEVLARSLEGELPFRVRRRVLANGSIYLAMAQLTDGQKFLLSLPDAVLPEGSDVDPATLTDTLLALCAPARQTAEVRHALAVAAGLAVRDGGSRLLPRLIRYVEERARNEDRWSGAIETHPAPLTIVWGREDPVAVSGMAEKLAARRPDATLVWLDAGHWPMLELPERFAEAVLATLGSG